MQPAPSKLARPVVVVCAVLGVGTALGLGAPATVGVGAAAAGLAVAVGARRTRPDVAAAALLFALALARAALVAGGAPDSDAVPATPSDPGSALAATVARPRAPGWGSELARVAAVGRWRRAGRSPARGRLTERGPPLAVEPGCVRVGEAVALARPGRAQLAARGPGQPLEALWEEAPPDELLRLAPARGAGRARARPALFERLRRAGLARLERLPDPTAAALHRALVFGDKSGLEPATVDLFTRTGTRHALALSGLHVGLLALLLVWPLARIATGVARLVLAPLHGFAPRAPRGVSPALVRAALVLVIVPLGGGAAPIARAATALALAFLAPLLPLGRALGRAGPQRRADSRRRADRRTDPGRRVDPPSLVAFALALECLADPHALASPSLALSYVATAGLVLAVGRCARESRALLPGEGRLALTGRTGFERSPWWRVPAQRVLDYARVTTAASLVAFLATLPLAWRLFGEASPIGIPATLVVVPLLAALLFSGWAWTLVPGLVHEGWPVVTADALLGTLRIVDLLPATPLPLPARPFLLVAAGAWLWLWGGRAAARGGGARRAGALVLGVALVPWSPAPREAELVALDVGHGTAVLLRAPGERCWLFDAGSRDRLGVGTRAVAPLLRRWEVARLGVVASHADRDHVAALSWICERWPPEVWAGAAPARCGVRLPHATPRLDLVHGSLRLAATGPGGLGLRLLRGARRADNEGSRALSIELPGLRLLLTGDAEDDGLGPLLEPGGLATPLDLLLLPHHGASFPLLGALLDRTRPRAVWVSASGPTPAAGALLRRGIEWRATAREGALAWPAQGEGDPRRVEVP